MILIFIFILSHLNPSNSPFPSSNSVGSDSLDLPELSRLAYFISGTSGDSGRLRRLLQALYHPRNYYLIHLDLEASDSERLELAKYVKSEAVVRSFKNVMVLVTPKGPTAMASTLHAIAILLKQPNLWDWFLNLGPSDYPLMPQDDVLHIFSYLPRDLNFLEHTSEFGWKEHQRGRPIIIDPGPYHSKKSGVFWAKEKRSLPASFKLFTGSAWVVLSRPFLEFCIWEWDNLPRMLSSDALHKFPLIFRGIFPHRDVQSQTLSEHNGEPRPALHKMGGYSEGTSYEFDRIVQNGAPFAHKISESDPVLNKIDRELLKRSGGRFTG